MEKIYQKLKELTAIAGVPGQEKHVKHYIEKEISPYCDNVLSDKLGSLIGVKNHEGPKIMIAGHMDEIGLLITQITKEGFIKFQTLGGWFSQVMLAQVWDIHTPHGVIKAVTGVKPPHIIPLEKRKEAIPIESMFLDVGVSSKEEAEKLGIRPGLMVTPQHYFEVLGSKKHLMSKAWDNRIGSYVVMEVLKRLEKDHPNRLYGAFTVQEEVGVRGAKTSSYMVRPDIAIAIDSGVANDVPLGEPEQQSLGKGPQILLFDAGLIAHQPLRQFAVKVAQDLKIPYQEAFIVGGRTDAAHMHLAHEGAPALSICIPTRYLHSHTSIIHYDDVEHTILLILEMIKRLDQKTVDIITRD